MKIVIAPDSFKECLSSPEVGRCLAEGVRQALPGAEVVVVPVADGGEGTVQALVAATKGKLVKAVVRGPLGEPVQAEFGVLGGGGSAVLEMAAASGLALVPPAERNPLVTTTFGTGDLIRCALEQAAKRILVGIGGSATVDGGAGMAEALGVRLLDAKGKPLGPGGGALGRLHSIDISGRDPRLEEADIQVGCDVDNPLLGPDGAARVYGPQKGATPEMVLQLEQNLEHLADVIASELGTDVRDVPGAGAAGGLGAGLLAFANARLRPGVEMVLEAAGLQKHLEGAALVITGEGKLDGQSAFGKTPVGVARLAKRAGVPVIAIAGALGEGRGKVLEAGIDAYYSIIPAPMTLEESIADSRRLIKECACQVLRGLTLLRGEAGQPKAGKPEAKDS